MRIFLFSLIFSFSFIGEAAQVVIPSTCYVKRESFLIATTVSVLVASALSDINCWVIQNKDGTNSVFGSINASTGSQGFEVQSGTIYQLYTAPQNFLYLRSSTGSINVDLISGRTTPN